jgi:hypothetical protein
VTARSAEALWTDARRSQAPWIIGCLIVATLGILGLLQGL